MAPKYRTTRSTRVIYQNPWTKAQAVPDTSEFLEVETLPFDQVLQMAPGSEIRDSTTVIAVLLVDRLRQE